MNSFEQIRDGSDARMPSDYVCARAAVTTSEQITVPGTGTKIVVMSSTLPFHIAFGSNPTAVVPSDLDDGTAHELVNPNSPIQSRTWQVQGGSKIAVIAASSTMVTASFYNV
jgi:hypothetical protein